ncbi:uncharacterized protein LOC134532147 [Bacillus rossius redtenbacheri]|uniref:uncharacterized protein LOC134532147 n=1 Tax=Bacillus rossius redtenbacheri TaxID=93214 RepID=UPI002FDD5CD2
MAGMGVPSARCMLLLVVLMSAGDLNAGDTDCADPGAVRNLAVERLSSSKARLSWEAPATQPDCAAPGYLLSYCSTRSYWDKDCQPSTLNLPPGTTEAELAVEACAYNHISVVVAAGTVNSSARSVVVAPRVQNPAPPTSLAVEVLSAAAFRLAWETGPAASRECRVGYRVCLSAAPAAAGDLEDLVCEFTPLSDSSWTNSRAPTAACRRYLASVAAVYVSLDLDGLASDTAAVEFLTAPENVLNLTISPTNQTAIGLEWSESRSVAQCADHYTVSWCNVPYPWYQGCKKVTRNLTTSETSLEITGLKACSYYWVVFSTEAANGLRSEAKELIITPPVVDEVRNLDLVYEYGSKFGASWDVVGGSACIRNYRVCWRGPGSDECDSARLNNYGSQYNLSLETCSNYTLDVASLDVYNGSSENITGYFLTGPDNVPDLNVSHVAARSALVTWDPSPSACADHYVLGWCSTYYPFEPCDPASSVTLNSTSREYNITSLEPCTYNIISISTRAADGRSSARSEQVVKTRLDKLGPTTHVELTPSNSRSFTLEYRAPADGARCIAGYEGCYKEAGSPGDPLCSRTTNQQFWTNYDHDTTACTRYDVTLTALADDNSTWSTALSFTAPPDEVMNLTVTNGTTGPNGSSVLVRWRVSPHNGCMTHQHLNCSRVKVLGNDHVPTALWSTSANLTGNVTEYEISGLEPCMSHTVDVLQEPVSLYPIPTEILFLTASNVTSVENLKVVDVGEHSVNVSYLAPEASPRCVAKHWMCWRLASGGAPSCRTQRGWGPKQVAVGGLQPCTGYLVSVTPVAPNRHQYSTSSVTVTTGCANTTGPASTTASSPGAPTAVKGNLVLLLGLLLWEFLFQ